MKYLVPGLFVLMLILHQDAWNWGNDKLFLGMLPAGLAYHAIFAACCAVLGWLAIKFAWPHELEKLTEESSPSEEAPKSDEA